MSTKKANMLTSKTKLFGDQFVSEMNKNYKEEPLKVYINKIEETFINSRNKLSIQHRQ